MIFYTDPNPAKSFGSNRNWIHSTGERDVKRHVKQHRLFVMLIYFSCFQIKPLAVALLNQSSQTFSQDFQVTSPLLKRSDR
jgi:hypothetical protein